MLALLFRGAIGSGRMQTQGEGERILVVDDEQLGRTAMQCFLRYKGYAVEVAPGAEAALAHLECGEYDLVVTDNRLPGMSETELAMAIKTRWPRLPIGMDNIKQPYII